MYCVFFFFFFFGLCRSSSRSTLDQSDMLEVRTSGSKYMHVSLL